jgi:chromate transporter
MAMLKLFWTFFKIGLFTVGGGYSMIPFVEKEAVEINSWVSKAEFLEIVALDTTTPGPIAVNLATFVGYKVNGIWGAVIATVGVVLPSLIIVTIIASLFYSFRKNRVVQAVLNGLKPAVIALLLVSIISLIKGKAIFDIWSIVIALAVFIGIMVFKLHPMWMIVLAGVSGFLIYYFK